MPSKKNPNTLQTGSGEAGVQSVTAKSVTFPLEKDALDEVWARVVNADSVSAETFNAENVEIDGVLKVDLISSTGTFEDPVVIDSVLQVEGVLKVNNISSTGTFDDPVVIDSVLQVDVIQPRTGNDILITNEGGDVFLDLAGNFQADSATVSLLYPKDTEIEVSGDLKVSEGTLYVDTISPVDTEPDAPVTFTSRIETTRIRANSGVSSVEDLNVLLDLNVTGDVSVATGDVTVVQGDVNVSQGDVNVSQGDVLLGSGVALSASLQRVKYGTAYRVVADNLVSEGETVLFEDTTPAAKVGDQIASRSFSGVTPFKMATDGRYYFTLTEGSVPGGEHWPLGGGSAPKYNVTDTGTLTASHTSVATNGQYVAFAHNHVVELFEIGQGTPLWKYEYSPGGPGEPKVQQIWMGADEILLVGDPDGMDRNVAKILLDQPGSIADHEWHVSSSGVTGGEVLTPRIVGVYTEQPAGTGTPPMLPVIVGEGGHVAVLNPANGGQLGSTNFSAFFLSPDPPENLLTDGRYLYFTLDNMLVEMKMKWEWPLSVPSWEVTWRTLFGSDPVVGIDHSKIYVSHTNHALTIYDKKSKNVLYQTPEIPFPPPPTDALAIVSDGMHVALLRSNQISVRETGTRTLLVRKASPSARPDMMFPFRQVFLPEVGDTLVEEGKGLEWYHFDIAAAYNPNGYQQQFIPPDPPQLIYINPALFPDVGFSSYGLPSGLLRSIYLQIRAGTGGPPSDVLHLVLTLYRGRRENSSLDYNMTQVAEETFFIPLNNPLVFGGLYWPVELSTPFNSVVEILPSDYIFLKLSKAVTGNFPSDPTIRNIRLLLDRR
jgi:hypothetical protein